MALAVPGLVVVLLMPAFASGAEAVTRPVPDPDPGMEVAVQDDASILRGDALTRDQALRHAVELRASWVRINALQVFVQREGFARLTAAIDAVRARGMKVQLTVSFSASTPSRWWKPRRYAKFVAKVVRRYKKKVARWQLYNEPDCCGWMRPLPGLTLGQTYRRYYQAGYAMVRRLDPGAPVLGGGMSPASRPLEFLRDLFCLDAEYRRVGRCAPLQMDGFSYHAYQFVTPPSSKRDPYHIGIGMLNQIKRALARAMRVGTLKTRNGQLPPLFIDEFGYLSDRTEVGEKYVLPEQVRARWLTKAFVVACRYGIVEQLLYYQLLAKRNGGWDTGIIGRDGEPQLPFIALRNWARRSKCVEQPAYER